MRIYIFTIEQENEIFEMHKAGLSAKKIGLKYNIGPKAVQRILVDKYNVKFQDYAKIGDKINGWEILDIYLINHGGQQVRMAKIRADVDGTDHQKECKLTYLTNKQIGYPDIRRPDLINRNMTHGESKTRLYRLWASMVDRCRNKDRMIFTNYFKHNITCDPLWEKYENFKEWSINNGYDDKLSLDRIDPIGNYEPSNCRWITRTQQASNKNNSLRVEITAWNETKSIYEWLHDERCKVSIHSLKYRIGAGWNPEEAISILPSRGCKIKFEEWVKRNHPEIHEEYLNNYHNV